ncbi:MAG: diacylglycerol kinase family lipid kinase [Bacteroidales bacterium]|jgi:YegS/Rv2252/BmrU family lipid kinase
MDILYIINPISGNGKGKEIPPLILMNQQSGLQNNNKVVFTKFAGEAREIARTYIARGFKKIIAVGGDGTVNEIASEVAGTGCILGIIPVGSGNGLARHLGIPMAPAKALNLIHKNNVLQMDTASVNQHAFFCTSGTGFDAHIGQLFSQSASRGFSSYFKATLREFLNYKSRTYRITIDGKVLERQAFLVTVANASQYGNNAHIAPQARVNDGWLDLVILKPFPLLAAPLLALDLFRKRICRNRYIETLVGKEIFIERIGEEVIHIDGEPLDEKANLRFSLKPGNLSVLVPAS